MAYRVDSIRLQPGFSRYLAYWLMVLHLLALLVLWQMQWNLVFKFTLSLILVCYFIWQIRYHLLRNTRSAIREVLLETNGAWWLINNNGTKMQGKLLPESFVKPWLVVLNFRTGSWFSTKSLILPPDSLDPDVARRLRVHLLQAGSRD